MPRRKQSPHTCEPGEPARPVPLAEMSPEELRCALLRQIEAMKHVPRFAHVKRLPAYDEEFRPCVSRVDAVSTTHCAIHFKKAKKDAPVAVMLSSNHGKSFICVDTTTDRSMRLSNLTPGTTYFVYIRPADGSKPPPRKRVLHFSTHSDNKNSRGIVAAEQLPRAVPPPRRDRDLESSALQHIRDLKSPYQL